MTLNTTNANDTYLRQRGNPAWSLFQLSDQNYDVLALWDIRCNALKYASFNTSEDVYWAERWEDYRLHYIGGRFLSKMRVGSIELYNEPDHDACMSPDMWKDTFRIRSQAYRNAYTDTHANGYDLIPLRLYGPASAGSFPVQAAPAQVLIDYNKVPFPGNETDDSYSAIDAYTFHRYGGFSRDPTCSTFSDKCTPTLGYGLCDAYQRTVKKINDAGPNWNVGISEFNSFMYATTDNVSNAYFAGRHVFDFPSTASALAGQVAGFSIMDNPPEFISVHKMVQNLDLLNSKQGKTGLFYGDIYKLPHAISGPTMTGEAYRLMIKRSNKAKTLGFRSASTDLDINDGARMSVYATEDDTTYYIYNINEFPKTHTMVLDLSALNVDPYSNVVVSATGTHPFLNGSLLYGDVVFQQNLNGSTTITYDIPPAGVFCLAVSKVPTDVLAAEPIADTTLRAAGWTKLPGASRVTSIDGGNLGALDTLQVSSTDVPSVAIMRFHILGQAGDIGIQNAVLSLHLDSSTNDVPQVVAVLGFDESWDENQVTWNSFGILKRNPGKVNTTNDNYINWWDNPAPKVLGHVVIPPGSSVPPNGTDLQLDVTDAVLDGITSFLVVKLKRYDQSTGSPPARLPEEPVQGWYTFGSREAVEPWRRPKLLVQYQTPPRPAYELAAASKSSSPSPSPSPIVSPVPAPAPSNTNTTAKTVKISNNNRKLLGMLHRTHL